MKTRIQNLFIALVWLALPALVQAQVNYAVSGNTAYVTSSPNASGNVVITNIYDGYPVTSIGYEAFADCSGLTSVTIPGSVTSIGNGAFDGCPSLTAISVDTNNPAFSSLNGVLFDKSQTTLIQYPVGLASGSYTIPNSVTSIGDSAFEDAGLTSVTIPNSVTSIEEFAFAQCYSLTNATIDNGVTSIGQSAFQECYYLTSVTIPNSVISIGEEAFEECIRLTSVTIGNSVTSIGEEAFGYTSLTSVTIPGSVTSIGFGVFDSCSSLTNATIDNGVTSIGESAFNSCTHLTSVTIPNSVTIIVQAAFYGCTSLTGIYFQGNSPSPTNDLTVFSGDPATVYYLPGTTGWGAMFDGRPTAPWFLANPQILNHSASFGVQPGGFGFTISWATNASVVVEASTNLANPVWIPVSTNTLTGGTNYFSDPQWTNYPNRFYRITSTPTFSGITGNLDVDMYNAAVADGTANGGVPAVMGTENGGPFRVTAAGRHSNAVCRAYFASCVFTHVVGTYSCSSTTLPSGANVIQFGTVLECGVGPYRY